MSMSMPMPIPTHTPRPLKDSIPVAVVQMNSQQDVEANLAAAQAAIQDAKAQGAKLIVLPENVASMGRQQATAQRFDELSARFADYAQQAGIGVVVGSLPCPYRPDGTAIQDGRLRQTSLAFAPDGTLVARYDKIHLFRATVGDSHGSYDEAATFEPGTQTVVVHMPLADGGVLPLGMMVCFDLRFPALAQRLRQAGAQLLTAPSAFTYLTGQANWSLLLQARALDSQCMVLGAAQGSTHHYKDSERQTWGHAGIARADGKLVAEYAHSTLNADGTDSDNTDNIAKTQRYQLVITDFDPTQQQKTRQNLPIFNCHRLA